MPIDDRTTNRSYQLPNASNLLAEDVARLRTALAEIDADIYARYTKTEVDALIASLVNAAPSALNTLQELAAALGNDPNFAATITTVLGQKANSTDVYTKTQSDARYVQGQVQVEMLFIATANQSVFTLSTPVINKPSALVSVDGVVQPTSEYSINMAGTQLTLSEGVPAGTNVRILVLGVSSEGAPADDSVTTVKMRNDAITMAKIAFDGGSLSGNRNAIINGSFSQWQEGTTFASPANNAYVADQWQVVYNGAGATRTITREAALGQTGLPGEGGHFLRFNQSVAGSSAAFNNLQQPIEYATTFAGGKATLSFYAKANAAISLPGLFLAQCFGTGGSPSSTVFVDLASGVVIGTAWQRYEFTVELPSVNSKTFGTNEDDYLIVGWSLPVNATFTFDLALAQLEQGDTATPFERRPSGMELMLCQRYYQQGYIGVDVFEEANGLNRIIAPFKVTMRTSPTIVQDAVDTIQFTSTVHTSSITPNDFFAGRTKNGVTGKGTWRNFYKATARL